VRQPAHLEQLRRRKPWTQKELAEAAGVSIGTVRGIEHGYYKTVRPRVIRAISAALGVEPAAIIEFRPSLGLPPVEAANPSEESDEGYAAPQTPRAC
jgi:transcriptional regulator with XRE-family HTH domain